VAGSALPDTMNCNWVVIILRNGREGLGGVNYSAPASMPTNYSSVIINEISVPVLSLEAHGSLFVGSSQSLKRKS